MVNEGVRTLVDRLRQFGQWAASNRRKVGLGVFGVLLISSTAAGVSQTQMKLSSYVSEQNSVRVDGPVAVRFNQELAGGYAASIEPKVEGSWKEERRLLGVTGISFVPAKRLQAGNVYKVRISGLKRQATGAAIADIEHTFKVQIPAAVEKMFPAAGAKDVSTQPKFSVTLVESNRGVRDLRPMLTPATPLKLLSSDDKTYTWVPEAPLKQGTAYTFTLDDAFVNDPAKRTLLTTPFNTVAQPVITSARTGGYFSLGQTVDIVFDQAMEQGTSSFAFGLPGKPEWANDHTLRFTPSDLKPGTTYSYTVKAGLRSKAGGTIETDRPYTFATTGAVGASFSPGGGNVALAAPIRVNFDQPVDHASAQARFDLAPAVGGGSFSWSGNTMIYNHSPLAYQTKYTYAVKPGVTPGWGLPNAQVLSGSFTTLQQTIKLNVPLYKQAYNVSCELASLRMVLAFYGINTNDYEIALRTGYNPRARDTASNSWDNPNVQFVGLLNGQMNSTGYGVHADPIAAAARSFGRNATAFHGIGASFIATNVYQNHPVIFWGLGSYLDGRPAPTYLDAWNTPQGVVQTWLSAHARVVTGVVGSPDNPSGFYINDAWGGKTYYWTTAQLLSSLNVHGSVSNMGVVVY
jgi:uncharacterized protein YvpB